MKSVLAPVLSLSVLLGVLSCKQIDNENVKTYCNPLDVDYTYMVYNSDQNLSYRSGADPAVVEFRGEYYMFVTRSLGYWHSKDLTEWEFVEPRSIWYPQGCNAPAARNYQDKYIYLCGDPSGEMSVLYSDDPASGVWKAVPSILHNLQDPDLFLDDDGKAFIYWGSSNVFPIKGRELDFNDRFLPLGETAELIQSDAAVHGWERFGENHSDTRINAYIEGPWMTKHNGRYYLQYAAPGTEFNVYGDGVYVGDNPLGPFDYQAHNPFCYKPGGFINGAGHGSTVQGPGQQWWHFATMSISCVVNWERRLCMYPTFFDEDGIMYSDTRFGDYPHLAPSQNGSKGEFAGWMLLSLGCPVSVSSYEGGFVPENLTDENCKTYWLASSNSENEWVEIDLGRESTVYALQINYYDHNTGLYGRPEGLAHKYSIQTSENGTTWRTVLDRRCTEKDTPNAYIQLDKPVNARYVRYCNVNVPSDYLAISEIRVFGLAEGKAPEVPSNFSVERCQDRRQAVLRWDTDPQAQGYNIYWGIAPDKLYSTWMLYAKDLPENPEFLLPSLSADQNYWFAIESFNACGVSAISDPSETKID